MEEFVPLFDTSEMSAESWYQKGCDVEADSPAQAARAYRRALAIEPGHAGAHANLGRLLHEAGNYDAAEEHYRQAVRSCPGEATYWYNLGVALEDQERYSDATHAYRAAITLDDDCRDAHFNLAGLLERAGDRVGALRHLAAYRRIGRGRFGGDDGGGSVSP